MTLALVANCLPRLIALLGANPGVWTSTVSGEVGAFPSDGEMTDALLLADGELITRGYFNSINNTLAQRFMVMSSPLASGDNVPSHYGNIGRVEVAQVSITGFASDEPVFAGIKAGQPASVIAATGGVLPTGLNATTTYYAVPLDEFSCGLAATPTDALAGTLIAITGGSGMFFLIVWQPGVKAESLADVSNATAIADDYVEPGACDMLWSIDQGNLYTPADFWRAETPVYTRTGALQANQSDEDIIVFLAAANLVRNASPALFDTYAGKAETGIQQIIRDGSYSGRDENP
jgi:hypothetical protein